MALNVKWDLWPGDRWYAVFFYNCPIECFMSHHQAGEKEQLIWACTLHFSILFSLFTILLQRRARHLAQNTLILEFMSPKNITSLVDADRSHHPLGNWEKWWEKKRKNSEGKTSDLPKFDTMCSERLKAMQQKSRMVHLCLLTFKDHHLSSEEGGRKAACIFCPCCWLGKFSWRLQGC